MAQGGRLLAVALLALAVRPLLAADGFTVVVNPSVKGTNVRRADLAAVFLKQAVRWGDRSVAEPVDQSATSPVRKAFSQAVLRLSMDGAMQYWQKQMFGSSPLRPPPVRSSDDEVVAFVAKTPGAVGYVSPQATLPPGVRALELIE